MWETSRFTFTVFEGALYFTADDGLNGPELWRTDGTAAGTVMVKDINASAPAIGSAPFGYTVLDGALHFHAHDGAHGYEPWKTDGTEAGTVLVADVCPGSCSGAD
jgi:ELWxxDGT repeat protein